MGRLSTIEEMLAEGESAPALLDEFMQQQAHSSLHALAAPVWARSTSPCW